MVDASKYFSLLFSFLKTAPILLFIAFTHSTTLNNMNTTQTQISASSKPNVPRWQEGWAGIVGDCKPVWNELGRCLQRRVFRYVFNSLPPSQPLMDFRKFVDKDGNMKKWVVVEESAPFKIPDDQFKSMAVGESIKISPNKEEKSHSWNNFIVGSRGPSETMVQDELFREIKDWVELGQILKLRFIWCKEKRNVDESLFANNIKAFDQQVLNLLSGTSVENGTMESDKAFKKRFATELHIQNSSEKNPNAEDSNNDSALNAEEVAGSDSDTSTMEQVE